MKAFKLYKAVYKAGKPLLEALPAGGRAKSRILAIVRKLIPDNRTLLAGASSPISFEIDGERFVLNFRPDDEGDLGIVKCLLRGGLYEPEVVSCLKLVLRPGETVIDGGAHIGYISLAASRYVGETGRVFSFEPFPESFKLLEDNIAMNQKTTKNILATPQALWKKPGRLRLTAPANCSVSVRWDRSPSSESEDRVEVEAIDIDGFCLARKLSPALIKLDVEGAEPEALNGAWGVIREFKPLFIIELNEKHYRDRHLSLSTFLDTLLKNGYQKCYILYARFEDREEIPLPGGLGDVEKRLRGRHLNCLFRP
jgi:FkbM family methyltransferase